MGVEWGSDVEWVGGEDIDFAGIEWWGWVIEWGDWG